MTKIVHQLKVLVEVLVQETLRPLLGGIAGRSHTVFKGTSSTRTGNFVER